MKSPLRWVGSKRKLVPDLLERLHIPLKTTLYEPFAGGASLFFGLGPSKATLSDTNPELINFYSQLRWEYVALTAIIKGEYSDSSKTAYLKIRANPPKCPVKQAAWFYYLNRTCFQGLWRVNRDGGFNVPHGRAINPVCDEDSLWEASEMLSRAKLFCRDALSQDIEAGDGDVVYFDPPYLGHFSGYTHKAFDAADHQGLAVLARVLDKRGCQVMISNAYAQGIEALYDGWRIEELDVQENVSAVANSRGIRRELLIRNW